MITSNPPRPVWPAMVTGARCRCPNCQKGKLFSGFLKVSDKCAECGEDYSHQRADDAPPYFTIFIVGHIIVPLVIWAEVAFTPALWLHMAIWVPITIAMSLFFLRPIKGAIVALQWANYMHGFDPNSEPDFPMAEPILEN
ncbi:MAG: DUF983 domain-containing protein [Cohaesibacter sp.]|nr:DUF983 domain-containing protein [Cohaesibacter sp.]